VTANGRRALLIGAATVLLLLVSVAAGTYWAVGPALRCELPAEALDQSGWSARVLSSGGLDRCYYLYVPSGHDPARPSSVVLSFHGFLSNPESHALITGWHELAEAEGFLLVYPQGTRFPQRWNAGETWGDPGVGDVQFYRDMLADLSAVMAVDPASVYVNGFSNGGGMAVKIGCEAADTLAAIGTVAGAVVSMEGCTPSRPVSLMAFHGTADPIVPYEGADMKGWLLRWAAGVTNAPVHFEGAEDWVAVWSKVNGCEPAPEILPSKGDVRGIQYAGCDAGSEVILYTIDEGGHTWPDGWPIPAVGKTSKDIDATEEMWRFFEAHTPAP
jgi:polyhydroxybutyrate depolymerase